MSVPCLKVRQLDFHERDVVLRMPFHFGAATVRQATQVFVRARIVLENGREFQGVSAELMVPKWFDKNPALSNEENVEQLRVALALTRDAYYAAGSGSAFGLHARCNDLILAQAGTRGLKDLVAGFGPAVIDRAILDALCKSQDLSFQQAARSNLAGLTPELLPPDLAQFDMARFLAALRPAESIYVRHTVGMADALTQSEAIEKGLPQDGLPTSLQEAIARYGHRYFKIKIGGRPADDLARLAAVAAVLDRSCPSYRVTLDGNEQYQDMEGVRELLSAVEAEPGLARLRSAVLFIEQPLNRAQALESDVGTLGVPVIIDESDGNRDAFLHARGRGYAGVSSKVCKGVYRSLINAARCAYWNTSGARFFMSAEDLTCPAGVTVQQDLALAALLGLEHSERNAHHFIGDRTGAFPAECRAFQAAHADLYESLPDRLRLKITAGRVSTASLSCTGFASAAEPDWASLRGAAME